jgi:hypothetical protein
MKLGQDRPGGDTMSVSEPTDVKQVAALLRAQATAIRAETAALGDALCRWRPAEGEWCVNEVIGHLIEAERRGFNGRIRTMLAEDEPNLQSWDQEAVARERRDHERAGRDLVAEFETLRQDSAQLVEGLRPDQLDRAGHHPLVGRVAVRDLLNEWVHHDRNHVKQMFSNVQAYVWPRMGNARRFSDLE